MKYSSLYDETLLRVSSIFIDLTFNKVFSLEKKSSLKLKLSVKSEATSRMCQVLLTFVLEPNHRNGTTW